MASIDSATALTLNEARTYLRTGEMPENYRERCEMALEFDVCSNCHGRRCMGCVLRYHDHDCADDCPMCCEALRQVRRLESVEPVEAEIERLRERLRLTEQDRVEEEQARYAAEDEIERLRNAYDNYSLWEPGRRGYADARRRLDGAFAKHLRPRLRG